MKRVKNNCALNDFGFTLVELMIAMVMAGIIIAALYAAYNVQNRSYTIQGNVVEMQQSLRAGMEFMATEIRMASYDPTNLANAGITSATAMKFSFTADLNEDGDTVDTNEIVTFCLSATGKDKDGNDITGTNIDSDGCDNDDGVADAGIISASLSRGGQEIANNIKAVEFFYLFSDPTIAPTSNPTATQIDEIQTVQISILAISPQRDAKYTENKTYVTKAGTSWTYPGNYRHRLLTSSVNIRNQGL
ncbi:MAG: prepilin-type N-terminal cleavage/methylation domain-containing protein [Desulfobulbaceae bacterium]|nr:prepilin-type N-terminal cleavage/methylation domain-containing protein [Desulfobulbaceae bacterium]